MSTPGTECFRPLKRTHTTIALQPRKRNIRIENSSSRCPACCSKLDTFSYSSLNKPFQVRKATNTPMEQTTKTITKARNRWLAVIIKRNLSEPSEPRPGSACHVKASLRTQ